MFDVPASAVDYLKTTGAAGVCIIMVWMFLRDRTQTMKMIESQSGLFMEALREHRIETSKTLEKVSENFATNLKDQRESTEATIKDVQTQVQANTREQIKTSIELTVAVKSLQETVDRRRYSDPPTPATSGS